jgi:predicted nucleic-acid-binding Zn-ribbon protein
MKCLKCQHELFDKDVVVAATLDEESKKRGEDKFEILTCRNCGLAQWYDFYVASGAKGPEKHGGKSRYRLPELVPFKCMNCQGESSSTEIITPLIGAGAKEFYGDMIARSCMQCGLAELYEIILSFSGDGWFDVEQRANLARAFVCPICKSTHVDKTGHDDFIKILPQRIRIDFLSRIPTSFIFCTCRNCKYMMLFHVK